MRRHSELGEIYGMAPDVVAEAAKYFRKQLRQVEVALSDKRPFLLGDQFSSEDILLTPCLQWAIDYKVPLCDLAHPYLERMRKRPGYVDGKIANSQQLIEDGP